MTHNGDINYSIENDPEVAQMLKLTLKWIL